MTSARTSGLISGAATGAATGSAFGVPGVIIGGVVGGIAGLISGASSDAQFKNQLAWANYNRQSQYNTDIYNINSSLAIAGLNAGMAMAAAKYNSAQVLEAARYNADMIVATTLYNEELLDNEMVRVWQDLDLDITQIEMFRQRERGNILATQSASGTIMNQDSNAETVISQKTQEAMDVAVVEFGADRQAANINNQLAQGRWQGEVAIQQIMWEGQQQANSIMFNAKAQSFGSVASAVISANANMYTAKQNFLTGGYNNQQASNQYSAQNQQNLISGLFSAASSAAATHYATKTPKVPTTTGYTSNSSLATGNHVNLGSNSTYSSAFKQNVSLGRAPTSSSSNLLTSGLNN